MFCILPVLTPTPETYVFRLKKKKMYICKVWYTTKLYKYCMANIIQLVIKYFDL